MKEINSVDSLYRFLESVNLDEDNTYDIAQKIKAISNKITDESEKEVLLWENYFFDFYLDEGKVKPQYSQTNEDGLEFWGYPKYEDFSDNTFKYIESRISSTNNPFLKARYSHILWGSPRKNQKYAKIAIDSYLKTIEIENKSDKKYSCNILNSFKNAFNISLQIKDKIQLLMEEAIYLIFEEARLNSYSKIKLIECLLDSKSTEKKFIEEAEKLLIVLYNEALKENDYSNTELICKIGEKLSRKLNVSVKDWKKREGDFYKSWAENRMDDNSSMIPLSMYHRALLAYKNGGCKNEFEKVSLKYIKLKKELKLNNIKVPYGEDEVKLLEEFLDDQATKILDLSTDEIFKVLTINPTLFPNLPDLRKIQEKKEVDFLDFAIQIRFDENKNISNDTSIKNDLKDEKLIREYQLYLNNYTLNFLGYLFSEGIKQNKIHFKGLVNYLHHNSWLGQVFIDNDSGGEIEKYSWLSLISPSFYEFFFQLEAVFKSKSKFRNLILPIDSLTLKFEGALRDFAQKNGIATITYKGNSMREKLLEDLFLEKKIIELFNENDIFLFQIVFTNKGFNLRNKVAHGFMRYGDYYLAYMYLLLVCFLRLGKYKLKPYY